MPFVGCGLNISCTAFVDSDDPTGSDEYNSVKGDLENGMKVLENELGLFKNMLMQKKLV